MDLEKQVALVTGGAQGIGRSIAEVLAANGAQVVIVDIEAQVGEQAAREVEERGGTCLALAGDVAEVAQMERVVEQVVGQQVEQGGRGARGDGCDQDRALVVAVGRQESEQLSTPQRHGGASHGHAAQHRP